MKKIFKDFATFDSTERTAISIRSGLLKYHASEIGLDPNDFADGIVTVYRSPATIFNASQKMSGIPITNEHVDMSRPAPVNGGTVVSSEAIDIADEENDATVAIKNKLNVSDAMQKVIVNKKELSLGYGAELVPHDIYDFEQKDIMPHHLAIVPQGRCGSMCSFVDHKPLIENPKEAKEMKIKFIDADGQVNMQQIIEVIMALPEAIKKVPVEQVAEIIPQLQMLIETSKQVMPEESQEESEEGVTNPDGSEPSGEEVAGVESEDEASEEEMQDEDSEEMKDEMSEEEKEKFSDKKFDFKDSKEFKDAVAQAVKETTGKTIAVVEKARNFLKEDYVFEGKDTARIMRDALKTQTTDKFADSELEVAFKLLKKNTSLANFGDSGSVNKWDEVAEKTF